MSRWMPSSRCCREALQDHADGFSFETVLEDGKPSVVIRSGPVGARTMRGMRHAIAAMAGQGNNLIVDDVIFDDEMPEYRELLSSFDLHLVGVMAPLEVLEAREAARADRLPGLARWQYERVHKGIRLRPRSRHQPADAARMRQSHPGKIPTIVAGVF